MSVTNLPFSSLSYNVSKKTLKALEEMGFQYMTEIQAEAIPQIFAYKDAVVSSKTGTGKTLAFLIPAVEMMHFMKYKRYRGTGCIILSPTRELALQTYGVLKKLMKYHSQSHGLIMGGNNRQEEVEMLNMGVNILVATPGRLADHLQNTPEFTYKFNCCIIIDEADRLLDIGFEEEVKFIISRLPQYRQSLLFSATLTTKTEGLVNIFLRKDAVYIGTNKEAIKEATVETLRQGYILVPSEMRWLALFGFLQNKFKVRKIMVFFNSVKTVKFYHDVFNYIHLKCSCIHGQQKHHIRRRNFSQFSKAKAGVLLCTDVVARGLDIPKVDWIIQFDPPVDPKEYIHRVGRTARGLDPHGNALMILRPEELKFIGYLKNAKVPMQAYDLKWDKIPPTKECQKELEDLVARNYYLKGVAKDAFVAYIRAYRSHYMKKCFDEKTLDLSAVAKSFGFPYIPCKNV